jgi:arabinose-5-phosphate isomerase
MTEHASCHIDAPGAVDRRRRILAFGLSVLRKEVEAVEAAADALGNAFVDAVERIVSCRGRVAVTGLGKAGLVGNKIQATLASTATPSYRLHPVEALHGDLGMICPDDVVLMLSRSGESEELVRLAPALKRGGCTIILLTACLQSRLACLSDIVIDIGNVAEACPLGLAPSSSTAAMLAVGDALALSAMEVKNVQAEHYAQFHPGGALGRSLMRVSQIMRTGDDCPRVGVSDTLRAYYDAVLRAPRRAGAASVVDAAGRLVGFFTHGDLFRLTLSAGESAGTADRPVIEVMIQSPKRVRVDDRVADALTLMRRHRIDELPVVDEGDCVAGLLDVQDLIAHGFSVFDEP